MARGRIPTAIRRRSASTTMKCSVRRSRTPRSRGSARAMPSVAMPAVIDVHAHIVPPFYVKAVVDAGLVDERGRPATDGYPVPTWSLDDTLRCMDAHEIA